MPAKATYTNRENNESAKKVYQKDQTQQKCNSNDVACKLLIPSLKREIHGISESDLQLEIKGLLSVVQIAGPLM